MFIDEFSSFARMPEPRLRLCKTEDLIHNVISLYRDRREDIKSILDFYISYFDNGNNNLRFSKSAITKLELYDWPGNISQLINYVEKTVILNQGRETGKELDLDDLAF